MGNRVFIVKDTAPSGASYNSPPNVDILGPRLSKTPPKFHEKTREKEERMKIVAGEVKKKSEILGGPTEGGPAEGGPGRVWDKRPWGGAVLTWCWPKLVWTKLSTSLVHTSSIQIGPTKFATC